MSGPRIRRAAPSERDALVDIWLRSVRASLSVDVNEQNPRALQFYLRFGFTPVGRSPTDSEGRPFPLVHLRELPA